MSLIPDTSFTKEQLFADLEKDGIDIAIEKIIKAKSGDGESMVHIGYEYNDKQQYEKAMAWYRMGAMKNHSRAQKNVGSMYHNGLGVPVDYLLAMEWFLKSASQGFKYAWGNIGYLFKEGQGVPVDKYKALEWYYKSGGYSNTIKELSDQGIQLSQQDKSKHIQQLITETKLIMLEARKSREEELKTEISSLKKLNTKLEKELTAKDNEVESLKEKNKSILNKVDKKQKEIYDQNELIEQYKREIQTLKLTTSTHTTQLEVRDSQVKILQNEITSLRMISEIPLQNTTKRIEEMEKSNQNLKEILEQERLMKENEIALMKQQLEASLYEEKKLKRKYEEECLAMKSELKRRKVSSEQGNSDRVGNTSNTATDDTGNQKLDIDDDGNHSNQSTQIKLENV